MRYQYFDVLNVISRPPINTGSPSEVAVNKPVVSYLGPLVVIATPGFPVKRPIPCAIIAAFS